MSDDDFDWADSECVVIPHQGQIAVYLNPDGDVVVRQEGDWWRKDDAWIVVRSENARRLCEAIMALAEFGQPDKQPLALRAPADRSAADRARRYRERKRHAPCDRDGVTERNDRNVTHRDATVTRDVTPAVTAILPHNGVTVRR